MRLDPIGALFGKAWKLYKERFHVAAQILLPGLVLLFVAQVLLFQGNNVVAFAFGGLLYLVSIIWLVIAGLALFIAIGKGTNMAASYRATFGLFWSWIWIAILIGLVTIGGYVMLIIPGIMLSIQLALAAYILVFEDKHGMAALAESREYIKGYWWAFLGRILLVSICFFAVILILLLPSSLIFGKLFAVFLYDILLLVCAPFLVSYQYQIYENFRRLKPDAGASAKKDNAFLKVAAVVGIVGGIGMVVLIILGSVFSQNSGQFQGQYQGGYNYNYGYPPVSGNPTLQ